MYILYSPKTIEATNKDNISPSIGNPGGTGGIGGGGSGAANETLQHKTPTISNTIFIGRIFIGRKSKKKISLSKFFIL